MIGLERVSKENDIVKYSPVVGGVEIPRQNGGQKRGDWIQLRAEELSAAMSWGRLTLKIQKYAGREMGSVAIARIFYA